jgi:conjugative relaxase-like TrwC/TraI family protein
VRTVLSIGKLSLGQEAYYLEEVLDGAEDYYLHAGEAPGRWVGRGAAALDASGPVEADALRAVLGGRRPDGELLRETTADLPGLDLTLKAPKSVSLIWGTGDEATAQAIVTCHEAAVDAAVTYFEDHACKVRRGHAGAVTTEANGFVGAAFRHRTSRAGDPALHTHVLVANMAEGLDGRWTALDTRQLYGHGRTAGFVYQAVLRHELACTLGLLFEEVERGYADVAGVPRDVRNAFSTRRAEITSAMERHGVTSARGAQAAALDTRRAKSEHLSEPELRRRWAARAGELGWQMEAAPRLVRVPDLAVSDGDIATRVTENSATFQRRDVVRAVAQEATQGATLAAIEARTDDFLGSELAVAVVEGRWTTPEMLALEERTVELAAAGLATGVACVNEDLLGTALEDRPSLGADQRRAVVALTTSGDAVQVLVGPAGTGKTFCLDAAREAWEASGCRVFGTALSARAAAELQAEAGIAAQTADRLLTRVAQGRQQLDSATVLVVDEAGMLGTRRLSALVSEAHRVSAKVVLVGDPRQLPEIEAGGLFASLAERTDHVALATNRRQRDPEERAAAHELRARQVEDAVERLQRHGHVVTAGNADLLRDGMVADWYVARSEGAHALILASRRSAVADLNRRAHDLLAGKGQLGAVVLEKFDAAYAVGDEVLAHRNDYALGVLNGDRGVVKGAREASLRVEFASDRVVDLPVSYVEDGHLTHGYASSIHKAQGATCDQAFVLGDDSMTVEAGYTGLTRGRDRSQVYLVGPQRDDAHGRAPALDPVDGFRSALHRSGAKAAAIDYLRPPVVER